MQLGSARREAQRDEPRFSFERPEFMSELSRLVVRTERSGRFHWSRLAVASVCALTLAGCPIDDRVLLEQAPAGSAGSGAATSAGADGQGGSEAPLMGGASGSGGSDEPLAGASAQGGAAGDGGTGSIGDTPDVIENCTCSGSSSCPDLDANKVADCDETLLQNAHFERDARAWAEDPGLELAWTAADAANSATSGALAVENQTETDLTGSIMVGAHQCVPISGGKIYELAAQVLLPAEPIEGTSGGMQVVFYSDESCAGKVLDSVTSNLVAVTPSWKAVKLTQRAPTVCRSARVRLVSIKSFRQAPSKILFDNVLAREE